MLGKNEVDVKPFRVLSITKGMNDTTRKITCIEYYAMLYGNTLTVLGLRYRYEYPKMNNNEKTTRLVLYWDKPKKEIRRIILKEIPEEEEMDSETYDLTSSKTESYTTTTYYTPSDPMGKKYEKEHGIPVYYINYELVITLADGTEFSDTVRVSNYNENDYLNQRMLYLANMYGEQLHTDIVKTGEIYTVPYDGAYEVTVYSDTAYFPGSYRYNYSEEKMQDTRQYKTKILELTKGQLIPVTGGVTIFKADEHEILNIPNKTTSTFFGDLLESGSKSIAPNKRFKNVFIQNFPWDKSKHVMVFDGDTSSADSYKGYCSIQYRVKSNRAYSIINDEDGASTVITLTEDSYQKIIQPPYTTSTLGRYVNLLGIHVTDVITSDLDATWQLIEFDKVLVWENTNQLNARDIIQDFGNTNPNNYIRRTLADHPHIAIYDDRRSRIIPLEERKTETIYNWRVDTNLRLVSWYIDRYSGENFASERDLPYFVIKDDTYYFAITPFTMRYLGFCHRGEKIYRMIFGGYTESALLKYGNP